MAYRSLVPAGRGGFVPLVHAEWTKFRTVRGWVIGMVVAILATLSILFVAHDSCGNNGAACSLPLGPGGEAVTDSFYFLHRPVGSGSTLTVRMTSLTGLIPNGSGGGRARAGEPGGALGSNSHPGLEPWSKAGIIINASTTMGSAYAAMMVTGSHGVRMQWDYTGDTAGLGGVVSAASPRWLRLTRAGDTITGYDSADGVHWSVVDTVTLPGLPAVVQAGMFAASPAYTRIVSQSLGGSTGTGGPTAATGTFDHVGLQGDWPGGTWSGQDIGSNAMYPQAPGGFRQAGDTFSVTGSGDIAPDVPGSGGGGGIGITHVMDGTFAGLIAVIVVGTMFITAEYRRGLIRTTLTASPRRGRVLAAKTLVTGLVTFAAGLVAAGIALPLGSHQLTVGGSFVDPVSTLAAVQLVAGTAALFAVVAVLALAIGAVVRQSAVAVTAAIVVVVLPWLLSSLLSGSASDWLLRVTPAAGFAIQSVYPKYPQINASYGLFGGYYPLAPWAGFAVLCGWTAVLLGLAVFLLRRRDA
jgi:ABC-type transport system involved in multi-copper enzyme maturation permease subunit